MTKFPALSLALTCLLAIGLASCAPTASPDAAPQETGVESPVPPQADLETPQPVQISIIDLLVDAPPEFLSGTLALHNLSNDAQAVAADAFPTLAPSLRAYGLLPVMDEGTYVYRGSGNSYLPVLEQLPQPGGVELEQQGLNNGIVRYEGYAPDGRLIQQYLVTEVPCGEGNVCVAAISTHEKDAGVLYAVELSGKTGEIVGVMPLVYKEVPRISDFGVSVGGNSLTMNKPPSYWMETANGEEALWRAPVTALSYKYENTVDAEVMTFQAGENVYSATHEQIYYNPEIGTYVVNADGVFVYDADSKAWYIPEQIVGAGELMTMTVGSRQVVQVGGELLEVEGTSEWKGQPVVQTEAGKMVWENGQWVELDQGIPLEHLAGMDEDTKRLLAIEFAEDILVGKEIVGEPRVEGNLVIWEQTEEYTDLNNQQNTRVVIAGAWDLESGEGINRYSYAELADAFDDGEIEMGERIFWNGEIVTFETIDSGNIFDAQNPVIEGHGQVGQGDVEVLRNLEGKIVAVNWRYFPTAENSDWMTYSEIAGLNGQRIIVLDLVDQGLKYDYSDVTPSEVDAWLKTSIKYVDTQTPMHKLVESAGSTVILVNGRLSNYPEGAGEYTGISGQYPLERRSSAASASRTFKLDVREVGGQGMVGVITGFTPDSNISVRALLPFYLRSDGRVSGSWLVSSLGGAALPPGMRVGSLPYVDTVNTIGPLIENSGLNIHLIE